MKEKIIEKRYGQAFIASARLTIGLGDAVKQVKALKTILHECPEFEKFLRDPEIAIGEKCDFLDRVLGDLFTSDVIAFIKFLFAKERIAHLAGICDYIWAAYGHQDTAEVLLKYSYPLDLEIIQQIKSALEERLHKKVSLYLELDAGLLGGIQVKIGNQLIDGSVRRRLDELREKLNMVKV